MLLRCPLANKSGLLEDYALKDYQTYAVLVGQDAPGFRVRVRYWAELFSAVQYCSVLFNAIRYG